MPTLPYDSPDEANDPKPDDQSNDPGMSSGVRIGITEIPSTRAEVSLEAAPLEKSHHPAFKILGQLLPASA